MSEQRTDDPWEMTDYFAILQSFIRTILVGRHTGGRSSECPVDTGLPCCASSPDEALWRMTRGEFQRYRREQGETDTGRVNREYKRLITTAIVEGNAVPAKNLVEYPDLFWLLTRKVFHRFKIWKGESDCQKINREYKRIIAKAVAEGKPVDGSILKDYPDLTTKTG